MIRTAIVLIAAMGSVAVAFQNAPAGTPAADARPAQNQTVIEKNSAFPVLGPVVFAQCHTEDCSDVPNQ